MTKILLVDDHIGILRLLSAELAVKGYEVITAANGEDGLWRVFHDNPDLVLLDVMMPVMNGFEVLVKIREHSNLPVVIHSFDEFNQKRALILGADDFIIKPFNMEKLIKVINQLID